MKIDFSAPILDLTGNPVMQDPTETGEPRKVTLGTIAAQVLCSQLPTASGQPEKLSVEEHLLNGNLALRIASAEEPLSLTVEEVATIKDRIARGCTTLTVVRAFALLDPKDD